MDAMSNAVRVPTRNEIAVEDTWDLSSLYKDVQSWERDLKKLEQFQKQYEPYRGTMKQSAQRVAEFLKFDLQVDRIAERVGTYAQLRTTEDQANDEAKALFARYQTTVMKLAQAGSFFRPEILGLPANTLKEYLAADCLKPYRLLLERIIRFKKHTLSQKEEELLSLQGEMASTANQVFRQLNDADMKFGVVKNEAGEQVELSHATYSQFMISPKRAIRKAAFEKYYAGFGAFENTYAACLIGSIHNDVFYARARKYTSCLEAALFPDNVPLSVYNNLIATTRQHLPTTYRYFDIRRRKMGLKDIHHYDTYVPILTAQESERSWDDSVQLILKALQPLGNEYCRVLEKGLKGRWCDRYPNQGKQSGAFSCGSFDGDPYILMNYKPKVLNDVFTLAHEAGHSMHSYYSAKTQPYQYYNYTIFVAEVASTFNEQLLSHYMIQNARSKEEKAYLINHEVDSIRATMVRQTMFAEFEKRTHEMAEAGEPLTTNSLKSEYRSLLEGYFGPNFQIDDELSLECLRIPHFYRAFYVYKYATGLAAAIALSRRVLEGGPRELKDYLRFLQSGCSKDPLDLLKEAGVDMTTPEPVDVALKHYQHLISQLDELI
jgi:oligoendopeptidase F